MIIKPSTSQHDYDAHSKMFRTQFMRDMVETDLTRKGNGGDSVGSNEGGGGEF